MKKIFTLCLLFVLPLIAFAQTGLYCQHPITITPVSNNCNIKVYHIQIFNRNGSVVFDSRDPLQTWDGNYGAQQVPLGTYYYVIKPIGLDNNTIKQAGYITLIH